MRTTLDIDEDILAAVKERARAEGKTMGQVISDLARQGLTGHGPAGFADVQIPYVLDDWPMLPVTGARAVTSADIQQLIEMTDLEDAVPFDFERNAPRDFAAEARPMLPKKG
jgi:hypothetical protein